jgi:hypothetical protein
LANDDYNIDFAYVHTEIPCLSKSDIQIWSKEYTGLRQSDTLEINRASAAIVYN